MQLHPLPRSLDPLAGEGLDGFLLRLSYRLERTPYRVAMLTGLIQPSGQQHTVAFGLLMHLTDDQRQAFAYATRLTPDEVADLCLSSMACQYSPASPAVETRGWAGSLPPGNHWVFSRTTRYCPQCLGGDGSVIQNDLGGRWHKTWRLPVVFACVKHTRFLEHLCPGCHRPIHDALTARGAAKNTTPKMIPQTGRSDLHPTQCRLPVASDQLHRRDAPTCGAELSDPRVSPAAVAGSEAFELQKRINSLLDPSTPDDTFSCGLPAAGRQYFIDLRLITHLIRASWPRAQDLLTIPQASSAAISQDQRHIQQQHRDHIGVGHAMYDVPPPDAKSCAALLTTADRLLQSQQARLLTEQLRHMLGYDPRSPARASWTRQILVGKPDCSPGLRQAMAPVMQTYTPLPAGRRRRALATPIRTTRYKPEHVAEFLQDDWYQRYFAHMDGICAMHLRRTAAIHLCQIAAGGPIGNAAELLGIPVLSARQSIKALHSWARTRPDPREFETALHALADELDSAPHLINYQRRREVLGCWCIELFTWQQLLNRLGRNHASRVELGDRKRQTASVMVWARVTQGEHFLAPHPIRDQLPAEAQNASRDQYQPNPRELPGRAS
jgi:TniQ